MGCGIKDDNNDICGETFTCGRCRAQRFKVLPAKQKIVYLCGFCESIDKDIAKELK